MAAKSISNNLWVITKSVGRVHKDSKIPGVRDSSEMLKNYKELKVWQISHQLCLEVYKITKRFPDEKKYGLTLQIRRAAVALIKSLEQASSKP